MQKKHIMVKLKDLKKMALENAYLPNFTNLTSKYEVDNPTDKSFFKFESGSNNNLNNSDKYRNYLNKLL